MIKNIVETSSNRTEWDLKEEKKENYSCQKRKGSVPEDPSEVDSIIHQHFDKSNNSPLPSLKSLEHDLQRVVLEGHEEAESEKEDGDEEENEEQREVADDNINLESSKPSDIDLQLEQHSQYLTEKQQLKQQEQKHNSSSSSFNESSFCDSIRIHRSTDYNSSSSNSFNYNKTPSPSLSQRSPSSTSLKVVFQKTPSNTKLAEIITSSPSASYNRADDDSISKSSDTSGEIVRGVLTLDNISEKFRSSTRLSERAKRKSWFNVLVPNYKSRCQDFKKLFKEVPSDERLIVDYSCAFQRDILVQGRLYVSQNYVCFHANIFRWETYLTIKWKDVTAITKEKTALVIPNAISISTAREKYFFATFATRDKTFLMLFRVWQNTLMNKQMLPQEMWQWVHNCYGDELGLTSDDEDYIDPSIKETETEAEVEREDEGEAEYSEDVDFVAAADDATAQKGRKIDVNARLAKGSIAASCKSEEIFRQQRSNIAGISRSIRKTQSSSSTTTTSGSDNKTSDNRSSAENKTNKKFQYFKNNIHISHKSNDMKSNCKELTLTSVKLSSGDEGGSCGSDPVIFNGGRGSGATGDFVAVNEKHVSVGYDGKRKVAKHNRQRDENINKNAEALPTDMSDSSDSDENKLPFVATAECNSPHEGRQLMHTILPINVDTLFNLLFSKSKFITDFHVMRKSSDTNFGDWKTNEHGQQIRTVNLTVSLSASVGPKTSKVTEYQLMRNCSKPNELYSIDINTVNAGIPYADSFSVLLHYCFVRTVDDHTMLSVHAQIKYKKSIWGVVKGLIEKNTWAGLEDFYTALLHALQSETNIPPAKGKGRRPRRGTAVLLRPIDETTPALQMKPDIATEKVLMPETLTPQLVAKNKMIPEESLNKYKLLSVFVVILLILLILLNVILLLKLWKLEVRIDSEYYSRTRGPEMETMTELPNSPQEWIEVVRQREILQETELKKWHKVLQTAIDLLKKVSIVCRTISQDNRLSLRIEHIEDEL